MFLGIIAKFLGRSGRKDASDGVRNQMKRYERVQKFDVYVSQGKGQKYLDFLTALHFMKTMILREKKKIKKMTGWWQELALLRRTELQAALVCTVTKRCSLGRREGKNRKTKKQKHSTPKQANYETQCNSDKVQSEQRDHSLELTGRR